MSEYLLYWYISIEIDKISTHLVLHDIFEQVYGL